jgi:hypothetical protein
MEDGEGLQRRDARRQGSERIEPDPELLHGTYHILGGYTAAHISDISSVPARILHVAKVKTTLTGSANKKKG